MLALSLLLAVGASACGGDGDGGADQAAGTDEGEGAGEPQRGGTFRMQTDAFEWTGNFDPTGEYLGTALGFYSNIMLRNMMGYRHIEGAEGNELIPDLAAEEPEIYEDGL